MDIQALHKAYAKYVAKGDIFTHEKYNTHELFVAFRTTNKGVLSSDDEAYLRSLLGDEYHRWFVPHVVRVVDTFSEALMIDLLETAIIIKDFPAFEDYRDVETINYYHELKNNGGDLDQGLKNVHQQGRDNVRTPIQWDDSPHGGFTDGAPWINVNPNFPQINAKAALADPSSIFYFYQHLLQFRKRWPTLIYGDYRIISPEDEQLFAYHRFDDAEHFYIVLNFSETTCEIPWEENGASAWILEVSNYEEAGDPNHLAAWEARIYRKG